MELLNGRYCQSNSRSKGNWRVERGNPQPDGGKLKTRRNSKSLKFISYLNIKQEEFGNEPQHKHSE